MPKLVETSFEYRSRYRLIRRALRARRFLALLAIGIAGGALAMNVGRTLWPETFGPPEPGTHPFTAFCILYAGVGLFQFKVGQRRPRPLYAVAIVLLIILIGISLELIWPQVRSLTGGGVCAMVFEPVSPFVTGHVKPSAALILSCIFASALLRRVSTRWGMIFAVLALAEVMAVLVTISLEQALHNHDIQIGTFLALVPLTLSMLTVYLHRPMGRLLFMADCIGRRTRVMVLSGILLPWFAGYLIQSEAPRDPAVQHFNAYVIVGLILAGLGVVLFTGVVQMRIDVERHRTERLLRLRSQIDDLTGVRTRRSGDDVLAERWRAFREDGQGAGIVLLDFDRFKALNEGFGPAVGDMVLGQVAHALGPYLAKQDMLCRWGGEEFLIVVAATSAGDLAVVGDRFRRAVAGIEVPAVDTGGAAPRITASVGMSWFQAADVSVQDAIRRADIALGQAKAMGRDRAVVHHPDLVRAAS